MAPMYRSAIPGDAPGGNTSAVVRQLSGARQACATLLWVGRMADLIMDSTGVIDWVVAVEETTTLSGVTPCAAAAARWVLTSCLSGSRAWAVGVSRSGSVLLPSASSRGSVRLARKYGWSGVLGLPLVSKIPSVRTAKIGRASCREGAEVAGGSGRWT